MVKILSYQVAENINLKKLKAEYTGELIHGSAFELFYRYKSGYIYILNYGVVVFANLEEIDRSNFLLFVQNFCQNILQNRHMEDFVIERSDNPQPTFSYNSLQLNEINDEVVRVTMLHVAQSVALDYYHERAEHLTESISELTIQLEEYGDLKISRKKLVHFIGKTLNTKNRIIDDLYVFDQPPVVWENELLGKVNDGLYKTFDIHIRYRELDNLLRNVESNLSIFIELIDTRNSQRLEWIIVFLILVEVIHLLLQNFLNLNGH